MRLIKISKKENNQIKKYLLAIPYCCGSSFAVENAKWVISQSKIVTKIRYIYIDDHPFRQDGFEYNTILPVIKVLRNPIKRFWSWHNRFVLDERERNRGYPNITKENSYCKNILDNNNIDEWFDAFEKDLYMNDTTNHTATQTWAHNRVKTTAETTYISTHDINHFLGLGDKVVRKYNGQNGRLWLPHRYYIPEADSRLKHLYKQDFELIDNKNLTKEKTLEFWTVSNTGDNYV